MKVVNRKPSTLRASKRNANQHPPESVQAIADSIDKFGWRGSPLVVKGDEVLAGHGRLLAAKKLKLETVPVVYVSDMTEEQARGFMISDNRTAELSDFDPDMLLRQLAELPTEYRVAWDEGELEALNASIPPFVPDAEGPTAPGVKEAVQGESAAPEGGSEDAPAVCAACGRPW